MKKNRITFLVAELILVILAVIFANRIFQEKEPQKRVAVIIPDSGDTRWEGLINGLKESAKVNNIHLIICNTDEISNAEEEKAQIDEQIDNEVDAFIICPAPGTETKDMLTSLAADRQDFILITEGVYATSDDEAESTGFATIKPDNYQIGQTLGKQMLAKEADALSGKKVGVVVGRKDTEAAANRVKGLTDALAEAGCDIAWVYNNTGEQDICEVVDSKDTVDYIAAMDTAALDTLGAQAENGCYKGAALYGVGSSMQSIALLDYDQVKCLVVPDGYGIGYESVNEIAKKLTKSRYTLKSHDEKIQVIDRDNLYSEDIERFLYSYE